jgi:flagellar L-ring protein precursor FlgH
MNKPGRVIALTVVAIAVVMLAGCSSPPRRDPDYAPSLPVPHLPERQKTSGAIFQAGHQIILFEDIKARRIGDLLTIKLVERTNASKSAESSATKDNSSTIANPTILGASPLFAVPEALPLAVTGANNFETNLSSEHEFKGKGDSKQSNSLQGDITVTIADVLPNGYLVVRGEKRMNLNQGNEYIRISGIVRPSDVAADNTVLSTRIADPTIIYSGDGQVADTNKMAWLARFFISAIFPF